MRIEKEESARVADLAKKAQLEADRMRKEKETLEEQNRILIEQMKME